MMRGLYTAAMGMDVQQSQLDVVTNNLANAATPGFKRDNEVVKSFPETLSLVRQDGKVQVSVGKTNMGAMVGNVTTDFSSGTLKATGLSTDMAIDGNAFFTLQDSGGNILYTRDGSFTVNEQGYLVTSSGQEVLGTNGPIMVGGNNFKVTADGKVITPNQTYNLRLVSFTNPAGLRKTGDDDYAATPASGAKAADMTKVAVKQGFLETSNVNLIKEMVDIISIMRSYESGQKVIQAEDKLMEQSVQLGSPQ